MVFGVLVELLYLFDIAVVVVDAEDDEGPDCDLALFE